MSEVLITFDKKNPGLLMGEINIKAIIEETDDKESKLEYKFLEGSEGLWKPIQDFSHENICLWKPKTAGKYMIMVQARDGISQKPYNHLGRVEYEVKAIEKKNIIEDVVINKKTFSVGDKVEVEIKSSEELVLYRFSIKGKQGWEQIVDYSAEKKLTYRACNEGNQEILIECKYAESENNVDEFTTINFNVKKSQRIEIIDFKCLTNDLLVDEELEFKVDTNCDDKRTLLYKFLKIDKNGKVICIQDFSTRSTTTIKELESGQCKLLCLVRDMLSGNEYDDRAIIVYDVKLYNEITIKKFSCDMNSPQLEGSKVNFNAVVEGGRDLLYKYIVEGPISEETGYIRDNEFEWITKLEGKYKVTLKVRDLSYDGEYEDVKSISFNVEKKGSKPVKIEEISASKTRNCIVGKPINIKVKAKGGTELKYSFVVYKESKEIITIPYQKSNWFNFTPEELGEYEVEVRALDKYSSKEYDSHNFLYLKVREYEPANIDYVLVTPKETYLVGDKIEIESIIQDTQNNLLRYVTKINGHEVEDTGYVNSRRLRVRPKCPGKYTFEIYAKNLKCRKDYDRKKEISIYVQDANPIRMEKINIISDSMKVNEEVTFEVCSVGGKEVCYEFYIMEKENWYRVQEYSRKNYYTFVPFSSGEYRILVFGKSYHKKCNYEDYYSIEFQIEE